MDIGKFLKFSEEICFNFLKNSSSDSIVLYGGSFVMLNFLSENIRNFLDSKGKKIEVIVDEKNSEELIKERYSGRYLINVGSLMENYPKC